MSNILNGHKIHQHFPFQGHPKCSQNGIFGFKINHLATLAFGHNFFLKPANLFFSSDHFTRRPRCPSARKIERKSDDSDDDNLTNDDLTSDNLSADFATAAKSPAKLNGRKMETIHNKIIGGRKAETLSDEDGWTTDF
jgi:hypothetical protein